jgi:hypothetical protein
MARSTWRMPADEARHRSSFPTLSFRTTAASTARSRSCSKAIRSCCCSPAEGSVQEIGDNTKDLQLHRETQVGYGRLVTISGAAKLRIGAADDSRRLAVDSHNLPDDVVDPVNRAPESIFFGVLSIDLTNACISISAGEHSVCRNSGRVGGPGSTRDRRRLRRRR